MEITVYFVGRTPNDNFNDWYFDSEDSAEDFLLDQAEKDELHIYSVTARVDWSTVQAHS